MKFFIYNPEPLNSCSNPSCNRFHSQTQDPIHNFDCYRKKERSPLNFQCSHRVNTLSEPHPRHLNKKYEKDLVPWSRTYISKVWKVSTRLDHLAAPIFRRVYTTKQNVESQNVNDTVKQNLNLQIQRSMYNIYSRLQNVKFRYNVPNVVDSKRKTVTLSAVEYENRLKSIERLSQPRKTSSPEIPAASNEEKRPINMDVIERLSIPRKIISPEQINYSYTSRPLKGSEYYEKLSQPKKNVEDTTNNKEPKLTSLKRIKEMAAPSSRYQRRKYMKGDNQKYQFPVSKAALQYKASTKINKLAVPRKFPEHKSYDFTVSRAALQYKPTAKIIKLAVPKSVREKPKKK